MDANALAGIVTAIGGAFAAVVGAVALLLKVSAPNSRAIQTLRSLWEWAELTHIAETVPTRIADAVIRLIDEDKGK